MKKVAINNLGCSKNIVDGENILYYLKKNMIEPINEYRDADIIVVNTCTFIKEATEEAINTILEMSEYKKTGKCTTLIVTGCFSERYRSEAAKEFPEVDLWVGISDWAKELDGFLNLNSEINNGFRRVLTEPIATQYLKISDGCSHNCSFCIIPQVRGTFRSRPMDSVVEEAKWLYSEGVKECIVVSQDTSFYGRDIGSDLTTLLKRIVDETSFPWIRMMYLHPAYVDDNFLQLIADEPRICSYFDIPLQHISDKILQNMGRFPLSSGIYDLIDNIRKVVPDVSIRSSFIVGYPGETEEDFEELLKFVEYAKLDKLGVFPYSPEEGTRAFLLPDRVDDEIVFERCERLMLLQQGISSEKQETHIGCDMDVIVDSLSDNPDYMFEARTKFDAPEVDGRVFIDSGNIKVGDICRVKIIDADDYDLFAKYI